MRTHIKRPNDVWKGDFKVQMWKKQQENKQNYVGWHVNLKLNKDLNYIQYNNKYLETIHKNRINTYWDFVEFLIKFKKNIYCI